MILPYKQALSSPANPKIMSSGATLTVNIDHGDCVSGMKPGMTFEIAGTFDMAAPGKTGQGFFIGVSDDSNDPTSPAKDAITLGYTRARFGSGMKAEDFP